MLASRLCMSNAVLIVVVLEIVLHVAGFAGGFAGRIFFA